jgi:hypothetical protein
MITGIVRGPRMSCAHAPSDTAEATVRCLRLHIGTVSSRSGAKFGNTLAINPRARPDKSCCRL